MSTVLHITGVETTVIRHDYLAVKITLVNAGSERVGPGNVVARQRTADGCFQAVEFFSTIDLFPGEQTKISQLLRGSIREIDFSSYRPTDAARPSIPLSGTIKRGLLSWSFDKAS